MTATTQPNNDKRSSSQHANALDRQLWIMDLLTHLGVAFGQVLTPERLQFNAADLDDIPLDCLERAFGRARRVCKFYPSVAELRALAGAEVSVVPADDRPGLEEA